MKVTTGLLLKFETKSFASVRGIIEKYPKLIAKNPSKWHEAGRLVMIVITNRPDTKDEGRINFFNHSVEGMADELKKAGVSVEFRSKSIEEEKTA